MVRSMVHPLLLSHFLSYVGFGFQSYQIQLNTVFQLNLEDSYFDEDSGTEEVSDAED